MTDGVTSKGKRIARVKFGALWLFEYSDADGKKHNGLSGPGPGGGQRTYCRFVVFKNLLKKKEEEPSHILYLDTWQREDAEASASDTTPEQDLL